MKRLCSGEGFLAEYFLTAVIAVICIILLFVGFRGKFNIESVEDILWFIVPVLVASAIGILVLIIIKRRA